MVKFIPFLFILYAKFLINLKQPEYLLHLFDDDASFFVIKFPTFPSNITLLVFVALFANSMHISFLSRKLLEIYSSMRFSL